MPGGLGAVRPAAMARKALKPYKSDAECIGALGKLDEEPNAEVRNACTPDDAFFSRLCIPCRGDWLSDHKETGQMFGTYRRKMDPLRRPHGTTDTILLVPLGRSFSEGPSARFLRHIIDYCSAFFSGMNVVALKKPLSLKDARRRENDFEDQQFLIEDLFSLLHTHKDIRAHPSCRNAYCRLGVTLEDIYPGEEWSYVFGQAKPLDRVGVFSFARHSPLFYEGVHATDAWPSLSNRQVVAWLRACLRTMVHETGHMLGILHCVYYQCLMNGSNGPGDTAGRSSFLCPVCLRKLYLALQDMPERATPVERYQAMLDVLLAMARDLMGPEAASIEGVGARLAGDLSWLLQRIERLGGDVGSRMLPVPAMQDAAALAGAGAELSDDEAAAAAPAAAPAPDLVRIISAASLPYASDPSLEAGQPDAVTCVSTPEVSNERETAVNELITAFREQDPCGEGLMASADLASVLAGVGIEHSTAPELVASVARGGERVDYEEFIESLFVAAPPRPEEAAAHAPAVPAAVPRGCRSELSPREAGDEPAPGEVPAAAPAARAAAVAVPAIRGGRRGAFIVNTSACTGKTSKDLFAKVAQEMGWVESTVAKPKKTRRATIFCMMQSEEALGRLQEIGAGSWVSRYLGMPDLCDKGNFARIVKSCLALHADAEAWAYVPRTWVLPDDLEEFRALLDDRRGARTYIVKPDNASQGDGIFMVQERRDFEVKLSTKANVAAVCQTYISKPLLLRGFKFDLRIYVVVAGGDAADLTAEPPFVAVCREGLARFCTEQYQEPSRSNLHKCMGHLTNYSLNKRSEKFVHAGEEMDTVLDPDSEASKRPLTAVLQQLEAEHDGFDTEDFYESLRGMVATIIVPMVPVLAVAYRENGLSGRMRCFQMLGVDVMLDHRFFPHLLEVNNSPSLNIEELFPLTPDDTGVKPCLCMEMSGPHRHQVSLVDLHVKKVAMAGAFSLLEQINDGEEPESEHYMHVDLGDGPLPMLARLDLLYQRLGGSAKAFSSAALRRHLGPLAGIGGLAKHDFDFASRRLREQGNRFSSRDRSTTSPLRLYDFIDMFRAFCVRSFPDMEPSEAVHNALGRLGF